MITSVNAVLLTGILLGGGGMSFEQGMFWNTDRNRDQRIDPKEAANSYNLAKPEVFKKFDRNNDGYILYNEFLQYLWTRSGDE